MIHSLCVVFKVCSIMNLSVILTLGDSGTGSIREVMRSWSISLDKAPVVQSTATLMWYLCAVSQHSISQQVLRDMVSWSSRTVLMSIIFMT